MRLIKTASGQRLQWSYRDWRRIGERTGWSVEAAVPVAVRPDLDLETETKKALVPLKRRLELYQRFPDDHGIDPRVSKFNLMGDLKNVLVILDESLGVFPDGRIKGDIDRALKEFLVTQPTQGQGAAVAKLKSIARQIARIGGLMGTLDPKPLVPRIIKQLKRGLDNLRSAPDPIPKEYVLSTILFKLTQMFPNKVYAPGPGASLEQLHELIVRYLSTPPDAHPRETEVQALVKDMLGEVLKKSASASTALLKFASGEMKISRRQWLRIGESRGWIQRLAGEKKAFKIAVDFDGTIAEHAKFPEIGEPVPDAFMWLRKFKQWGDTVIIFTIRSGKELDQAVEYCREHGLEFDGINEDPDQSEWTDSPKAYADVYIDDLGIGCPLLEEGRKRPCVDWSQAGPMIARMRKLHK